MHIISDKQHVNIVHILVKLLTGESTDLQEVKECLSYLSGDCLFVSCPFERQSMKQLAEEVILAANRDL